MKPLRILALGLATLVFAIVARTQTPSLKKTDPLRSTESGGFSDTTRSGFSHSARFRPAKASSARPLSEIKASALQSHVVGSDQIAGPRVVIPIHVVYSTGFEMPEYVPGNVETGVGQEHWSSSFTNNSWSVVSGAHPNSGLQHMRLQHNTDIVPPTAGTYLAKHGGAQNGVDVFLPGPDLAGAHRASGDIAPYVGQVGLNGNGNGYSLTAGLIIPNGSTFFEARLFLYDYDLDYDYDYDDIAVLDDAACTGATSFVVVSDAQWGDGGLPGFYHTYRIDMDSAAPCGVGGEPTDIGVTATQVKYYRDNVLIYSGNFPFGATVTPIKTGNTVGGTRFVSASTGFAEMGDFENMSLTNYLPPPLLTEVGTKHRPFAQPSECPACPEDVGGIGHPIYAFSGEFYDSVVDLRIPGRGVDFVWARKYRSRIGPNTAQGNGWDYDYNISIQASAANRIQAGGLDRIVLDGNTRTDVFLAQPDGSWTRPEFFRSLNLNLDTTYSLTFENIGKWNFNPLEGVQVRGSQTAGKIATIVDRNGNTMSFSYDGSGRLVTIHDTLDTPAHNRDITIAYNTDGFISSVTDWMGRQVVYSYYQNGDAGGSFGDLKSVRSPIVNVPPPADHNNFPAGKTTVYTYSKGFADARLNGNLLTITDGKGQTYLTNVYASTQNPTDLDFDHVVRQVWGNQGPDPANTDTIDIVYVAQTPSVANNMAVIKTIVNDRVGNVTEHFYDGLNRFVMLREYTGRADPDQPTTETVNLPINPLRPGGPPNGDPSFFVTRNFYNADSQLTRVEHPNGNITRNVYESEINPGGPRRSQGNLREVHHEPGTYTPVGDQPNIVELYEYDEGMGGCCGTNFVTKATDGRGNVTLHTYDPQGNRLSTTQAIVSVVDNWEYNSFGQMTAHVLPANGPPANHRRRDEMTYYSSGPQMGYLQSEVVDSTGFALTTTYEYDAVGNVVRTIDPRGHDTLYTRNALNQVVREQSREVTTGGGIRYENLTWYDANDNVVRVDVENRDETGTLQSNTHFSTIYEYDILNRLLRTCAEKGSTNLTNTQLTCAAFPAGEAVTTEYQYDANRNRTLVRTGEAVSGGQPNNTVQTLYDERDLVYQVIRAPADATKSTTQIDYDANRNQKAIREGLESSPRVTTSIYDAYDRRITAMDAMGNAATSHYDANGNTTSSRVDGELNDVAGNAGNVRLSEITLTYDAMNRNTQSDVAFFDTQTQGAIGDGQSTTLTAYADNSQVTSVTDDNGHATLMSYDTANRRSVVTDAKGNTATTTYDANSNVISLVEVDKSDLGNLDQSFTTVLAYDNLDRRTSTTDAVGNVTQSAFDSRSNLALSTDALGRQARYVYDGLSRLVQTIRDLDGDSPDGDGTDIITTQTWDDTSRLTGQGDDNGNVTGYAYDALNRRTSTNYADGTVHSVIYDVHDDPISECLATGVKVIHQYDLLNRPIHNDILFNSVDCPQPNIPQNVSNDTTFETYQYDGLSRTTSAINDGSTVLRQFDSMSHVTRETLNGVITQAIYDGDGNKVLCTYPGGRAVASTYDALDRHLVISDGGGTIATYNYIGPGRAERRTYGNGTRTDFTYDGVAPNPANDFGVRRPVRITHSSGGGATILDDRSFTWDRVGSKTRRKDERIAGPQLKHDYSYDAVDRLVQTHVTDGGNAVVRDSDYGLDGVGNRTSVTGSPDGGNYSCSVTLPEPADCQLNQYTKTSFDNRIYDKNGNLIGWGCLQGDADGDGLLSMTDITPFVAALLLTGATGCSDINGDGRVDGQDIQPFINLLLGGTPMDQRSLAKYDYRNLMVENRDTASGRRDTYAYDAIGRRISKVVDTDGIASGPTETRFYLDRWREIEEQNSSGTTLATYVFGNYIDEALTMRRSGSDYYYHTDDLYNVMAVSDSGGAVVERYEYADYGEPSFSNSAGQPLVQSGILNPLLFTGRRYDSEAGWYYYRTRYLDQIAGRFTSRDSIGIWGDVYNIGNGYVAISNRPFSLIDPFGRAPDPGPAIEILHVGTEAIEAAKGICEDIPDIKRRDLMIEVLGMNEGDPDKEQGEQLVESGKATPGQAMRFIEREDIKKAEHEAKIKEAEDWAKAAQEQYEAELKKAGEKRSCKPSDKDFKRVLAASRIRNDANARVRALKK